MSRSPCAVMKRIFSFPLDLFLFNCLFKKKQKPFSFLAAQLRLLFIRRTSSTVHKTLSNNSIIVVIVVIVSSYFTFLFQLKKIQFKGPTFHLCHSKHGWWQFFLKEEKYTTPPSLVAEQHVNILLNGCKSINLNKTLKLAFNLWKIAVYLNSAVVFLKKKLFWWNNITMIKLWMHSLHILSSSLSCS